MLCEYDCGQEAKYQLNNGKWCCEKTHYHCPEMKKKFLGSKKEKVQCPRCGRLISKNTLKRHLTVCLSSSCKHCGIAINSNKKFCNSSCAASYNNAHKERKPKNTCAFCNKKTTNQKYCSSECTTLHRRKLKWEEIKSGKCHENRTIREHIIEHYGNKCWICGTEKWRGQPVPLILDHIDGNPYNDEFKNFRLVCGNCDMQLPTYKGKNVGNGRHNRRKRYKEGKSY